MNNYHRSLVQNNGGNKKFQEMIKKHLKAAEIQKITQLTQNIYTQNCLEIEKRSSGIGCKKIFNKN